MYGKAFISAIPSVVVMLWCGSAEWFGVSSYSSAANNTALAHLVFISANRPGHGARDGALWRVTLCTQV